MENLQKLYENSNTTLSELAKVTGFAISTVSRYVKGQVKDAKSEYYNAIYKALINSIPDVNKTDVIGTDTRHIDVRELKEQMNRNSITANNNHLTSSYPSINTSIQRQPHKGEIWYIKGSSSTVGREMWSGSQNRPCVVIQNTKLNGVGTYLCVYLTKQPKEHENPTFVTIQTNVVSTAVCSQLNAISKERFVNCVGSVTEVELSLIERSLLTVLDIKINPKSEIQHMPDYIALKTELAVYKRIYEDFVKIQSNR